MATTTLDAAGMHALIDEHGVRCPSTTIVRFMFAGDRIASESVFLDAASTRYTDAAFDASFRALAGVETI
jgi:hypothetical protein